MTLLGSRRRLGVALLALAPVLYGEASSAFPPYRSTDADTAEAGTLELRLGLLRVEREDGDGAYASPLLRANLGLSEDVEIISEFEYRADERRFEDGAIGFKWVPLRSSWSVGVETLALRPVSSRHDGSGVESQLLVSYDADPFQLHLNAGGFYDARPRNNERGWRASILAEFDGGRFRPGLELFAKEVRGEHTIVQAGPGFILDLGPFDVRSAVHVGLTSEAPDLVASLWISWSWPLWQEDSDQSLPKKK